MICTKWILHILLITLVLVAVSDARGGRRGGSIGGGLFGSWRKYKKPASSGSTRRLVSSSPVHTPITKALNDKKTAGSDKFFKNGKVYNSYNTPPLPPGGTYHSNTATMPGNAIYVAQAPPRGAEIGNFLTGYLTGRLMTMGFSPYHYHHVTHVYRDNPNASDQQQADNNNTGKVIVINNNNAMEAATITTSNVTESKTSTVTDTSTTSTNNFNSTSDSESSSSSPYALAYTSSAAPDSSQSTVPPLNGIICMPFLVNEKNSNGEDVQIERIVCYPAPEPPAPVQNEVKSKPVEIAGDIVEH